MRLGTIFLILLTFLAQGCKGTNGGTSSSSSEYCGFERPPYIARINLKNGTTVTAEALVFGLHVKPDAAYPELNMLDDVIEETTDTESISNVIALGDFNASCSYLSSNEYESLDLVNKLYTWLVDNNADTNTASSSCAYDRIIHKSSFSVGTKGVDTSTGPSISDHYPVFANFQSNGQNFAISAFNLQRYGPEKAADSNFINSVKTLIQKYDLILLQEITTTDQSLINLLIPNGYDFVVSERLGTSSYKEQYAYVFNSKIDVVSERVYSGTLCTPTYKEDTSNSNGGSFSSCISDGYICGASPYITPGGQCWATKDGRKVRTRDCCCGI
jgi:hypothetical protein